VEVVVVAVAGLSSMGWGGSSGGSARNSTAVFPTFSLMMEWVTAKRVIRLRLLPPPPPPLLLLLLLLLLPLLSPTPPRPTLPLPLPLPPSPPPSTTILSCTVSTSTEASMRVSWRSRPKSLLNGSTPAPLVEVTANTRRVVPIYRRIGKEKRGGRRREQERGRRRIVSIHPIIHGFDYYYYYYYYHSPSSHTLLLL